MVAKIKSGKSLIGALMYNENKVKTGKALLLASSGYPKNDASLTVEDKLFRLTDLAARNHRTKTNTLHLSLNFAVGELLPDERLIAIADSYMDQIGFKDQPYLVYKHFDAGHPHMHIVTTNIQASGERISLNNIGRLRSEPARKAVELAFGLVKAGQKDQAIVMEDPSSMKAVEYGKVETKRAISNIVNGVTRSYKYTSLPELNAILHLYHVTADRGSKASTMYQHGGLHYWLIDKNGKKNGVPIKASTIYEKPTLKLLEDRFKLNEYLRKPFRDMVRKKIDRSKERAASFSDFIKDLKGQQIMAVVRQNEEGRVYGISYVDQLNKVVFNGSDLGKAYSAAEIVSVFQTERAATGAATGKSNEGYENLWTKENTLSGEFAGRTLLDELLTPLDAGQANQGDFDRKKKRRKKKRLNL